MNLKKKKKHLTQQRDAFKGKSERGLLDRKIIFETDLKKKKSILITKEIVINHITCIGSIIRNEQKKETK